MTEIPAAFHDLMTEKKAFAHLATLQPDGTPQVTPVWFDYTNGIVRVNTAKGRVKARNMSVGSKVAMSILDPDNSYRYIQIRGEVTKESTDGAVAHINSLAKKYMDKGRLSVSQRERRSGDLRDHADGHPNDGLTATVGHGLNIAVPICGDRGPRAPQHICRLYTCWLAFPMSRHGKPVKPTPADHIATVLTNLGELHRLISSFALHE